MYVWQEKTTCLDKKHKRGVGASYPAHEYRNVSLLGIVRQTMH